MAHFIYEYSANLPAELLDMAALMEKMHFAAAASGVFPLDGLRSRAIRCEEFRVGDGNPDNGFVNLSMKVGQGRDVETRLAIGRQLFEILVDHLQPLLERQPLAISFEMRELEAQVKFNHKNL
jgi:5-carboxymethyl-2-hydroxymuconate isomerase